MHIIFVRTGTFHYTIFAKCEEYIQYLYFILRRNRAIYQLIVGSVCKVCLIREKWEAQVVLVVTELREPLSTTAELQETLELQVLLDPLVLKEVKVELVIQEPLEQKELTELELLEPPEVPVLKESQE